MDPDNAAIIVQKLFRGHMTLKSGPRLAAARSMQRAA
jgi:hypothetical protein